MKKAMLECNLNKALDLFKKEAGFEFYSLLTDESTKKEYYDLNQKKDFSKYIDENKNLLLEIEEIQSKTRLGY